jgi:hypothetical protein
MGAFVWARRALNHQKRRFPARAAAGGQLIGTVLLAVEGAPPERRGLLGATCLVSPGRVCHHGLVFHPNLLDSSYGRMHL